MFERRFKTWCETTAVQQRRELGLRPIDPLDPKILSTHLGVDVWTPDQVPGLDRKFRRALLHEDPGGWSAVTLSVGSRDVIILNSSHSQARCASDLMHELAHVLIGHNPGRVDVTRDGLLMLHTYNQEQEDEAAWLAGCLLLPREALLWILGQGVDLKVAARKYGVSDEMLLYRLNVTGAKQQMRRARAMVR